MYHDDLSVGDTEPVLHPQMVTGVWIAALAGLWPVIIIGSSVYYYKWRKKDPARAQALNAIAWRAFLVGLAVNLAMSLFIATLNHKLAH